MSHTSERSMYPNATQIDILLDQLEKNPDIAKGYLKNQNARQRAQAFWEQVQLQLNSVGGGAIKSSKQWMKYWTDKKSATKKKAAQRAANRRRTGGGVGVQVEISTLEERIVALLGGESFATGDTHLAIPLFQDSVQSNIQNTQTNSNITIELPAIVYPQNTTEELCTPELISNISPTILEISNQAPLAAHSEPLPPPAPATPEPPPAAIRRRRSPTTPAQSPRHRRSSLPNTPRRRRIRARASSPPSQRQSQFVHVTDRFVRLEERRIDLEESNASLLRAVLERTAQREHTLLEALNNVSTQLIEQQLSQNIVMAEAIKTLGEGLKALSEAIKKPTA